MSLKGITGCDDDDDIIIIIMNKIRERMYWEGGGKIFKLKKQLSTRDTTSTTYHDSNLLLQPENLYTV